MKSINVRSSILRFLLNLVFGLTLILPFPGATPKAKILALDCYSLNLIIDGGMGDLPIASPSSSPKCPEGEYIAGTIVEVQAFPAENSNVFTWRGTVDDTSTSNTNQALVESNQEVGVHYVHNGDPYSIVNRETSGGIAKGPEIDDVSATSIIGTDDRAQVSSTTIGPAKQVVYLYIEFPSSHAYSCTGTVYGPKLIITAGHCVYDSNEGGWASGIWASPARNGNAFPYGTQSAQDWESTTGWVIDGRADHDFAAVIMPDTTLSDQTGWWRFGYYSDAFLLNKNVTIVGYPGDKPTATMWADTDPITSMQSQLIRYTIDTYSGQSGSSPYFISGGIPIAVGIHSSNIYHPSCSSGENCGARINKPVSDILAMVKQ